MDAAIDLSLKRIPIWQCRNPSVALSYGSIVEYTPVILSWHSSRRPIPVCTLVVMVLKHRIKGVEYIKYSASPNLGGGGVEGKAIWWRWSMVVKVDR